MNKKDFALAIDKLHKIGFVSCIQKNGIYYNVIVNFEIVKTYKTRISCKRLLIKKLKEHEAILL